MKNLSVVGRLGRDGELKRTKSGEAVLNLNVAVDDRKKVDGTWTTETLWIGVTLFGKRAEGAAQHCKKGVRIAATGDLNVRTYEARDGGTKTAIECLANSVDVLFDKRADGGGQGVGYAQRGRDAKPEPSGMDEYGSVGGPGASYDDDIPFAPVDTRGEV